MNTVDEFVFWQGFLSIHQSAFLRSLAMSSATKVTLVVEDAVVAGRRTLGWHEPDFGRARIIIRPTSRRQSELLSGNATSPVHVFSGTRGGGQLVWNAFRQSISSDACIALYSEAPRDIGPKGLLRLVRSRLDALQFGERISIILGIGNSGVNWFRKSGYLPDRIFPFGYFVETPSSQNSQLAQQGLAGRYFDLVFVGRLGSTKGWDFLLYALHGLKDRNWRLHVVGDGVDRGKFVGLCAKLGLTDSVRFYGTLPNSETISTIWKSDLLVLPSRWDGWGAVVNEALMCGVPVVCSDKCGAADLLDGGERGEVFPSGDISALRSVLGRRISQGKKDAATSERIRHWSSCISGESAADYFLQIVNSIRTGGSKPVPPWFAKERLDE